MLGCARKASASRCHLSARGTAVLARERTFLIPHIAQTLAQRLELIEPDIIDFGMVTAQNDLMLVVAENAAFELAWYGHGSPLEIGAQLKTPDWRSDDDHEPRRITGRKAVTSRD